jgi:hypothetical protein
MPAYYGCVKCRFYKSEKRHSCIVMSPSVIVGRLIGELASGPPSSKREQRAHQRPTEYR